MPELARLSPEHELLLALARHPLRADLRERGRFLAAQAISWPAVSRQALEHGVFPLVSGTSSGSSGRAFPPRHELNCWVLLV